MSFSLEFTAKNKYEANQLLARAYAPGSVKAFIEQHLACLKEEQGKEVPIYVKAQGHLYSGTDYETSTATIEVRQIRFTPVPK
jgi:hypothetical protein